MGQHWVGIIASGSSVVLVGANVSDDHEEPLEIVYDQTFRLQKGDRGEAFHVMYQQCAGHLEESGADTAFVKASSLPQGSMNKGILNGAEVRGVVIAAAASVCPVQEVSKAAVSRTYGDRKVDEYLKDNDFWEDATTGTKLRIGSREAAMLLVAARSRR